jgi:transposase InsO family protein
MFPWTSAPAYLIRDNAGFYGHVFTSRVRAMGIRDRPISRGSPWQNGYAVRLIGTVRRECLDRMLIFGELHLRRVLAIYAAYYNQARKDITKPMLRVMLRVAKCRSPAGFRQAQEAS